MKKPLALLLAFIAIASFAHAQKPRLVGPKNYNHVSPKNEPTHNPYFLAIALRILLLQSIKTNCL